MSSTFNVFRKYQKHFMAVLLLVAMFTFVVAPPIASFLGMGRTPTESSDIAVTWKGGNKLSESGLRSLYNDHQMLMNFLDAVMKKAQESGGQPKVTPPRRAPSEEDIVLTLIKANKATEMGLVVTEETMINYLRLLSDSSLQPEQMNAVMHEATGGRLRERPMFTQLRTELLSQKLEALALVDLRDAIEHVQFKQEQPFAVPPSLAWDYFRRMHRRVRAEMYPLKSADFIKDVKEEPTPAQIKELYEKYKDEYPDPYSPDPGFKQNNQVAFQYVKVDFNELVKKEKAKVTDKEIEDYYEKNKATSYVEVDLPELPGDKSGDKDPAGKKPDDENSEDKKTDDKKPEDKKPDDKDPDAKKPEEKGADDKKPADKKPEDEKPEAKKPEGCQDDPAKPKEEKPKPEPKDEDPAKADPKATDPKKSDPAKTEDPKGETPEKTAEDETEKPKEPAKPKKKEIKYKPLTDKLKEEIRVQIARPLANDRLSKAMKEVQEKVRDYGRELHRWEAVSKLDVADKEPKPADLDVKQLARSLGVNWGETPLVDAIDMLEDAKRDPPKYELSKAQQFDRNRFSWNDFAMVAFGVGAPLFETQTARLASSGGENDEVYFIFWRTEEKPPYVPDLDKVKEKVIDAWKRQVAFGLAKKAAESLAESIGKSGKSLRETLPVDQAKNAFETDAFSWLSRSSTPMGTPGQLGISRIKKAGITLLDDDAVDTAGQEFMAAVFALKVGDTGVAINEPKTEAYVVRILEQPISEELLMLMFLDMPNKNEIYMLAFMDRREQIIDWQRDLQKEMAIKWKRDPYVSNRM